MTQVALSEATVSRQVYACILIVTFSFGVSPAPHNSVLTADAHAGIYVVLAGLTLRFLLRRSPDVRAHGQGGRVVLAYTCGMLAVTTVWYMLTARNSARALVVGAGGDGGQVFWRADNIAENVLATVQFVGSDALMVGAPILSAARG
jgi:hypothetical protein